MDGRKTILLIGTADTKSPELAFLAGCIRATGADVLFMDVGVLAGGSMKGDVGNAEVAAAAGISLAEVISFGDENRALAKMAEGAALLAARLHKQRRIDGMLALGGSMGTDLALDVATALPLGVPKLIVSTIAYSHLIPPDRIPPDLMMILWAGGLYGLNDIGRSSLAQAAGAVVGAANAARPPIAGKPLIGMTSLGTSCLSYMTHLLPALERRGYEVAVFHSTGMGGRAFEALAAEGHFAAVMDFCLQELTNHFGGSVVTAGEDRLTAAGRRGVPQLVAPGAIDMIDFPVWKPLPAAATAPAYHAHNRLLASITIDSDDRRTIDRLIGEKLAAATGPTVYLLPARGIQGWDRQGEALYDPQGLAAFVSAARTAPRGDVPLIEIDAHINDQSFADAALAQFDDWVRRGIIPEADDAIARAEGAA